jgi:hypothetical protein
VSDQVNRQQHSINLALQFYEDHRDAFEEAALKNSLDEQWFDLPLVDFDRWLVMQNVLEQPADAYDSNTVQRYGVVQHRNGARGRINLAARKATEHPAYSIGGHASRGALKVKLVELYARDAPADIAGGFRTSTSHYLRQVKRIVKLANSSDSVSDAVRQRVNLCASVMEPLLSAFTWAGMNMQAEIRQQDEGRSMGLSVGGRSRRRIK